MYKKLLDETNFSGNITNFIISLKKELKRWKLASLLLILVILFLFLGKTFSYLDGEPILTKQIKELKKEVIAEVRIDGPILADINRTKMFEEIAKSEKIKGMLIIINSPGGLPNASEIIYSHLKKLSKKMPVVAFIEDVGASGGYMIAIGADSIVAMKTSIVGSIGVRSGSFNFARFMQKYEVDYEPYNSSEFKAAGDPFEKTTPAQREYLKETTNEIYKVFAEMVKNARGFNNEQLKAVANAKIFYGDKALELKLIDVIGTKDVALEIITKRLEEKGLKNIPVQEINPEPKKVDGVFGKISSSISSIFNYFQARIEGNNVTMAEI